MNLLWIWWSCAIHIFLIPFSLCNWLPNEKCVCVKKHCVHWACKQSTSSKEKRSWYWLNKRYSLSSYRNNFCIWKNAWTVTSACAHLLLNKWSELLFFMKNCFIVLKFRKFNCFNCEEAEKFFRKVLWILFFSLSERIWIFKWNIVLLRNWLIGTRFFCMSVCEEKCVNVC